MKRFLLLTAMLLAIASLAAFAGGQGESGEGSAEDEGKTVVTFRSWSPVVKTTEAMIEAFEAENPDIAVEATITNYPEYTVDLRTRAASDTMPDLVGLEPGAFTQQYREFLMPIQDLAEEHWGPEWQDKFHEIGLEQIQLGNPAGDDNYYGLPVLVQTINMWYTVPVFEEYGLEPPETYEEMVEVAEVLRPQGIAPLMVGAKDGWLRRDIYMLIINTVAPGLIYEAEVGDASFTEEPFVEAMRWWKRMFDDGIVQDGALGLSAYPGSQELIEAGRAGMFPLGAWWMQMAGNPDPPPLSEGLTGFAPMRFPALNGSRPEGMTGGIDVMIGITKSAEDPEAAFRVLADFIDGAGAQVLINTFNDIPAVKGLEPESFPSEHLRDVWATFTEDWMPNVVYNRQLRDPDVKEALENALAAVAAGDSTPEEAMQSVQDAWEPLE
jgi:raffinose/stachyose/melibiose transport system substrate-binding protein